MDFATGLAAGFCVTLGDAAGIGPEPSFEEQLKHLSPCDLVIVEGFKFQAIPKIEVYRTSVDSPPLHPNDPNIIAVATDAKVETNLPVLDLNDDAAIAQFILGHLKLE